MICAVIDTNVIVAAMMSKRPDSATVKVMNAIRSGSLKPVLSSAIVDELLSPPRKWWQSWSQVMSENAILDEVYAASGMTQDVTSNCRMARGCGDGAATTGIASRMLGGGILRRRA